MIVMEDKMNRNYSKMFMSSRSRCVLIADAEICEEGSTTITVEYSGGTADYDVTLTQPTSPAQTDLGGTGVSTFTVSEEGTYSVSVLSKGTRDCCSNRINSEFRSLCSTNSNNYRNKTICDDGSTTPLTITLVTGDPTFTVDVAGNTETGTGTTLAVDVSAANTYSLSNLTDANGCIGDLTKRRKCSSRLL